jgi:hypothetical protein
VGIWVCLGFGCCINTAANKTAAKERLAPVWAPGAAAAGQGVSEFLFCIPVTVTRWRTWLNLVAPVSI